MKVRSLILFLILTAKLTAQEDQLKQQQEAMQQMQRMFSSEMQDSLINLIPDSISNAMKNTYGIDIKKEVKEQLLKMSENSQHSNLILMQDSMKKHFSKITASPQKSKKSFSLAKAFKTPDDGPTLYDYALEKKEIGLTIIRETKSALHKMKQRRRVDVPAGLQRPQANTFSSIPEDYDYDKAPNSKNRPSSEESAVPDPEAALKEYEKYFDDIQKNALEFDVLEGKNVKRFEELKAMSWKEIKSALPPKSVAIEFTRIKDKEVENLEENLYAAAIFRSEFKEPKMVILGHIDKLSKLLAVGTEKNQQMLYTRGGIPLGNNTAPSKELYDMVWGKIDQMLEGIQTVYFAPDGLLHEVAFSALQDENKKLISEKYDLHQLGSTRTLIEGIPDIYPPKEDCWIVAGGLSYHKYPSLPSKSKSSTCNIVLDSTPTSYHTSSQSLPPKEVIEELPGSLEEVEVIAKMLEKRDIRFQKITGSEAPEEYFKRLGGYFKSPGVLHLATHGFYIPSKTSLEGPKQSAVKKSAKGSGLALFESIQDPKPKKEQLERSGLYLSGAAKKKYSNQNFLSRDDGYWLASEIAGQDLTQTKLVVLSACNSGKGDVNMKEGVFGMQRAFKNAGVGKMIVSLWEISDAGTAVFMENFYTHWLSGKTAYQAMQLTQQDMRKHPTFNTPYYWAAFVLLE